MKIFIIWTSIILLAYFASDIIEKGITLNSLTPWPIVGTLLWCTIIAFLWFWLIQPIIQFTLLKRYHATSLQKRRKIALRHLKARINAESDNQSLREFYNDLKQTCSLEEKLKEFTEKHDKRREIGDKIIMQHCQAAAVAVVFNRNNLLDGLIMLTIQVRLVVRLAVEYGYKPSPVFNTLCILWVLSNSLLSGLFTQNTSEAFANAVSDLITDPTEIEESLLKKITGGATAIITEAALSGTAVYVTGNIFQQLLLKEGSPTGNSRLQEILRFRKEGRKAISKLFLTATPDMIKKIGSNLVESSKDVLVKTTGKVKEKMSNWKDSLIGFCKKLNPFSK